MKALLLCQNLRVGGAEELVLGASTHLPNVGVQAEVVAITSRGPIADEIARSGVAVHLAHGEPGPRDPRAFAALVRLLRREQPDVVHTYLLNANLYGRMAAGLARVPIVLAAEQNVYRRKARRHIWMERLLAAGTYRIVACCRAVGIAYRRQVHLPEGKLAVVYNAVHFGRRPVFGDRAPARARLDLPGDAQVLGTLGRLTEQKGQSVLLEAVARLAPRFPRLILLIGGEGPLRADLEATADSLGIAQAVRFVGVRRDRDTFFAAMDHFVLPSLWEGLSLALVEAMGAGRSVVATEVGGNPEVVEHGRNGLLVPPNDAVTLAASLEALLIDLVFAAALGTAAAADARARFSIERHVAEIADLYRGGLAARASPLADRTKVGV